MVGLTERQALAGINFRMALEKKDYAPDRVDKLLARYVEGQHKWRAENIARTESMQALNRGQNEAWRQSADAGYLDEAKTEREWLAAGTRVCPRCLDMDGQRAPLRGTYPDDSDGPPKHPSCRCGQTLKFLT